MATKYTFYFSDTTKPEFSLYPYTANGPVSPSDPTLIDQAVAQTTTLKLYGKGMQDYGEGIEQNLIYMLENFANSTSPVNPKEGQLWYNNVGSGSPILGPELSIYNGSDWLTRVILTTGTSAMTGELILSGDPVNALGAVPKQYLDQHINDTLTVDVNHITDLQDTFLDGLDLPTLTAAEVNALIGLNVGSPATLTVQNQLDSKISRTGDAMDAGADFTINGGNLNILAGGGSPLAGNLILSGGEVLGLPASPSATAAASKEYVDAQVVAGGADGTLTNVDFVARTGSPLGSPFLIDVNETTLELTVTYPGSPSTAIFTAEGVSRYGHGHAATEITFDDSPGSPILGISGATVQAVIEDIDLIKANLDSPSFINGITVTGAINVSGGATFGSTVTATEPVAANHLATKNYVDNVAGGGGGVPTATEVQVIRNLEVLSSSLTGSPISPYEILAHTVDDNKVSITINGLKQYSNTFGVQRIQYDLNVGVILTDTYTGLDTTRTYEFAINVDGAGPVTITIPPGAAVVTHGSLIATINSLMTGSPELALALFELEDDDLEKFTSYSSGTGSSIAITDPGPSGSPESVYLFATDPSPTPIIGGNFVGDLPMGTGGSPVTPDDIIISGDVTSLFPVGKTFTIRGSVDATYGTYDSVYSVYVTGAFYTSGSPGFTTVPIGWVGDFNFNMPLFGNYLPGGSPAPALPSPSSYGDVHFTPIGGFDLIDLTNSPDGTDGDYAETDISGNVLPPGEFSSYVVFNYTIPSGNTIENMLIL